MSNKVNMENEENFNVQVPVGCYKHPSCCQQEGCPGNFTEINGSLIFQGTCCYSA
jgi:hypothetical protein|tara:strand:+ start:503 stop:667 length:165 start_codon:yes stop_codon:yes gene_type:complete